MRALAIGTSQVDSLKNETVIMDTKPLPLVKKERNFPELDLSNTSTLNTNTNQPVLVIQSPKTPTLSRKLKAVSLDSDPPKEATGLEISRDVFSMPNTPKRQIKSKLSCDLDETAHRSMLVPNFCSNLKRFASNSSISGSQTLKTLPEIMTLQDFSDVRTEPIRIKAKGLLERRGSNASLTIDLGSNSGIPETTITTTTTKPVRPLMRLNTAKSVSNLNLSSFGGDRCNCSFRRCEAQTLVKNSIERRKSQTHLETCGNCIIYESVPCKTKCQTFHKRCSCFTHGRRKSLSNENLYVPPCNFCQISGKECSFGNKHCKGYRKACYPRQPDLDASQLLSEDFKLHLQNVQYLQTAGSILSINDLKLSCESDRVPKLHQEFWEVPLNLQEKCLVSGSQSRNRYRGVLPNEHSRVHLPGPQTYIHANYIKGPDYTDTAYIATQGPMSHTCRDFWEMVWTCNSNCIVMLTGLVEKGRSKCELYFPLGCKDADEGHEKFLYVKTMKVKDKFTFDSKNTQQYEEEIVKFEKLNEVVYGDYKICYVKEDYLNDCVLRQLELFKLTERRLVHHYWYPNWQDHKMANPEQVLQIALHVLELMKLGRGHDKGAPPKQVNTKSKYSKSSQESHKSPIVVHCSAGIGRTGCFLAILNGIQQLRSNFNVDVLAILCSLRLNRGGMVQTAEQYELIHRVLSLYADRM